MKWMMHVQMFLFQLKNAFEIISPLNLIFKSGYASFINQ